MKSGPWLRVARGGPGNARSPRYVLLRNSIVRKAKNARDRRPVFPNQDMHRPGRRETRAISQVHQRARQSADGGQALCQISDRVRQPPYSAPSLERNFIAFLRSAVTASAFRVPGPAILSAAAIFPNRWGCPPRCIRNRERSPHRSVRAEPRNRSPPRYRGEEYLPRHAANRAARGPDDAKRWIHAPRATVRSPQAFFSSA